MQIKKHLFALLFGLALLAFTGYLLADTFLIKRVYAVVAADPAVQTEAETESDAIAVVSTEPAVSEQPEDEPLTTDTSYADGNVSVALQTYRISDTTVYVADVRLASPDYLKTAFAENSYGRNVTEKTSSIASSVGAVLAINGDYYGVQRSGYVIRSGVLYRNTSAEGRISSSMRTGPSASSTRMRSPPRNCLPPARGTCCRSDRLWCGTAPFRSPNPTKSAKRWRATRARRSA